MSATDPGAPDPRLERVSAIALDLPEAGTWTEVLNSDAEVFGGSGQGNLGAVTTDGRGSATLTLPPLGVLWLHHRAGA